MEYKNLYDDVFDYLVDKGIYFAPRKNNRKNKLNDRRWFLGTDHYMCISFWNGYDHNRKVPNIHLQIHSNDISKIRLVLTSRNDESKLEVFQPIVEKLQMQKDTSPNHWHKNYLLDRGTNQEIINKINDFIAKDKAIIDSIVSNIQNESISHISSSQYDKWINKIMRLKNGEDYIPFSGHEELKVNKTMSRKGVKVLNDSEFIRSQLPSKSVVKRKHIKLQNKLKQQLLNKSKDEISKIIFEENFIDLLVEYNDRVEIYEVKPFDTATKNIQYGLGQLMRYYHEASRQFEKKICIFIAGPAFPKREDDEFIDSLKSSLQVEFAYLEIT